MDTKQKLVVANNTNVALEGEMYAAIRDAIKACDAELGSCVDLADVFALRIFTRLSDGAHVGVVEWA